MSAPETTTTRGRESGHVHLAMTSARTWDRARFVVLGLALAGVALFVVAFFQAWWSFWLYAPQYPGGLRLSIGLRGMGGDVHEIDLLNHYIGMHHLEDAAPLERRFAGYGVGLIGVTTAALVVAAGRKLNKIIALPALAFPAVFLADSLYWLVSFGHHLDPRAPLKIAAFTPQMFGNGKIGQFETFAQPDLGFWLALAGAFAVAAAVAVRSRVCAHCRSAGTCRAGCHRFLVLPERGAEGHAP